MVSISQPLIRVFVYGTLKPGEAYHQDYCAERLIDAQEAIALGQLYALPLGYPAMTEGDRPVYGYLFSFADPSILPLLDELEGYDHQRPSAQNEYDRKWIEVYSCDQRSLGSAWGYVMTAEQALQLGGILIPHGRWIGNETYFS